jgi:hypothetical protein
LKSSWRGGTQIEKVSNLKWTDSHIVNDNSWK